MMKFPSTFLCGVLLVMRTHCFAADTPSRDWAPIESGIEALLALQTGDPALVPDAKESVQSGIPCRTFSVGDYILTYRCDTGHLTSLTIPRQPWCENLLPDKVVSAAATKNLIKKWSLPERLGYPAYIKFEEPFDCPALNKGGSLMMQRISKNGKFSDEKLSIIVRHNADASQVAIGTIGIRVSLMDADSLTFDNVASDTELSDIEGVITKTKFFQNVAASGKTMTLNKDRTKIDKELVLVHENNFFDGEETGISADLTKPVRRARQVTLVFNSPNGESGNVTGYYEPISHQFVAGYVMYP